MIHIEEAVIVEGKYDKIKLSNFLDAMIVETGGFAIYKDKKRLQFIRRLAMERGIIILTDSDHSGFQIRNYIAKGLPPQQVKHLYIPDVYGKEHRKQKPAKEGKLGVEGIDDSVLMALFDRLQVRYTTQLPKDPITSYDLYAAGLAGTPDSQAKKEETPGSTGLAGVPLYFRFIGVSQQPYAAGRILKLCGYDLKPLLGAAGQGLFCAQGVQVRAPALQPEQRLPLRGKGFYICHTGYGGKRGAVLHFRQQRFAGSVKAQHPQVRRRSRVVSFANAQVGTQHNAANAGVGVPFGLYGRV